MSHTIDSRDLAALDLNLLRVFHVVMQERSVTRAARRLALTQPALSNALGRLRRMLGDELFLKTPDGVRPTPRAEQIAVPIARALAQLEQAFGSPAFVSTEVRRDFRVAITDYAAAVLLPGVLRVLAREAPGIHLRLLTYQSERVLEELDRGEIDLGIGGFARPAPRFLVRDVVRDSPVLLMAATHRFAGKKRLSLAEYAGARHMLVSPFGQTAGYVDEKLAGLGLSREVVLTVHQFLLVPLLLEAGDVLISVPRHLAARLSDARRFASCELPRELADIPLVTQMIWPKSVDADPAHAYVREQWLRAATGV